MTDQLQLPDIQPEPSTADDAERAAYRERLREYLRDPDFRAIEGFPIGDDGDILTLSDPPTYTACPNPFLPEIIQRWQAERAQLRAELGLPDDSHDNDNNGPFVYRREPFASDVSEGKNDPIYNAHSYHTKVPHKAVMRYILHYTDPGDIVFDGFCGTGMTGVAAQLCSDRQAVQSLGYLVDDDGLIYDSPSPQQGRGVGGGVISRLGARKAVLVDLCPAATFIAYNYNTPVDVAAFEREAKRILREVENECNWMYETWHPHSDDPGRMKGHINYTVWSDVFVCPQCGEEMVFWDVAVDKETGYRKRRSEPLVCGACGTQAPLGMLDRAWVTGYDTNLSQVVRSVKRVSVLINYSLGKRRYEKAPDPEDLAVLDKIEQAGFSFWFPTDRMPEGDESRRNDDIGITHVHHFYTKRNLWTWACLIEKVRNAPENVRARLFFWTQSVALGQTLLNRYLAASFSQVNRYLKGTLYVAPFISEVSPRYALRGKIQANRKVGTSSLRSTAISSGSATSILIPDSSVDYIFTDPPFGSNISYSDLNFIWESWLGVTTNNQQEAIVSKAQGKRLVDYQQLMVKCFEGCYRVLKPGRWMTVEFHNSSNAVWNAIQEAIIRAGFVVADVRTLDKKQMTMQQMTSTGAVKQDLIISAYKPRTSFERRFQAQAGTPEGAWQFVRQHLGQLPVVVKQDGALEVVAERQAYLLFDRMVAFHIQRGATVPLSAAQFYAGLRERFIERDGMYFLPDQAPEYDRARLEAESVAQLTLFVSDEKSTIQWLRQQLDPATSGQPQTYQDLQPQFLRQLHQARHEALPELGEMLEQNFLQDEAGRWYVADPGKASDLEKLRQRALLREFAEYVEGRGRLRQFRTEAVRAGFADAWHRRDYATIVKVAERLPERVLQEDPDLLMYYDNATLRVD
jgi:DNA modification methylase